MSKELGTLCIVVLKAQHLPDKHTFYKQDPYVKLSLSGATQQTPVDPKGGQHPVWDCELRFPISRDPSKTNRTLTISVFSKEKKDDELLGEADVDITDTLKSGEFDEWVPLSMKGAQQRGDVYLEMTFFAAGPAPLTRRPSKFKNPTERLAQPQQSPAQRQHAVSQPRPSLLSPGGQGPRTNLHEDTQEGSRQRRPSMQVRLPGAWPGPSAQQQHHPAPPAAPSHPNRRSSKGDDSPLPPLPQADVGPKEGALPSILRPGGPSRTTMQPIHESGAVPGTPVRERYSAGSPSLPFANGYHNTVPSDTDRNTYRPHPQSVHQNSSQLPGPLTPHVHIHSPSLPPAQSHVQYTTQGTPEHVGFSSGGHGIAQPFPQAQPTLTHAQYHSQQPPPRQPQQGQHSPPQQAQPPAGQPSHHTPPYAPDSHLTQSYGVTPGPTLAGQPYVRTTSPAPPRPYVASQTPSPPALSQTVTQNAPSLTYGQPYASPDLSARPFVASPSPAPSVLPGQPYASPDLSARPFVASPSPAPSVLPAQPYPATASSISHTQQYAAASVPSVQPYSPISSVSPAQSFVSSTSTILSPPVHPPAQSTTTPSPPLQSYISPPNSIFPLPTSPPPMGPYGPSYAPAPSFPLAHTPAIGPFSPFGEPEPDLPDPYLLRRYQTPLPLPAAAPPAHSSSPNAYQQPSRSPPRPAAAPAPVATGAGRNARGNADEHARRNAHGNADEHARRNAHGNADEHARRNARGNADEHAVRELQLLEEERMRARREQEERDAEFARTLDRELNLGQDSAESAPQGSGRPSLPPLRM